jgi:O-antigen ligase
MGMQLVLALMFRPRQRTERVRHWRVYAKRLAQIGLVLIVLVGVAVVAGTRNNYFSRLWSYWTDEESTGTYFQYIAFSQRFVYWQTAYDIFEEQPLLGIGLGNFTFYFADALTDRPLYPTPELLKKVVPEQGRNQIVVTKNLSLRLLSETGLLGMATFTAFIIAILGSSVFLYLSPDNRQSYWGRAGLLGLVVFIGVTFSVDSFAIPNMWVLFGLIASSSQVFTGST